MSAAPVGENRPTTDPGQVMVAAVDTPPVVARWAPRVMLHPQEQYWPMGAATFVEHSNISWNHSGSCPVHAIDSTVEYSKLSGANTEYTHRVAGGYPGCAHEYPVWHSNQGVRPRELGGPDEDEGLFMNLNNAYRDGQELQGDEPVLYEYRSGVSMTFWFNYGYSETAGAVGHEGEWERIAIRLNASDVPQEVEYFQHKTSCTLPWVATASRPRRAPRNANDGRPVIWAAKGAHGSYPAGGLPAGYDKISGSGRLWVTGNRLRSLKAQGWYGYGGGWGQVGSYEWTTGPDAPPFKTPAKFIADDCNMG